MFKKILKLLEWVVFIFIIFIAFAVLSPILPTKKIVSTYVVISGSMEPNIKTGSIAFSVPIDPKTIKKNDIVTFFLPNDPKQTILHRIIEIKNKQSVLSFQTKGDNNNAKDGFTIDGNSVSGKYIFSIPLIGYLAGFMKTPAGFIILICLPALILIFIQIKYMKEGMNEEINKRAKKTIEEMKKKELISLLIFLSGILIASFLLKNINPAHASFKTTSQIKGITLTTRN
jgi:signal peptidase I